MYRIYGNLERYKILIFLERLDYVFKVVLRWYEIVE